VLESALELARDPQGRGHDSMSLFYRLLRPVDRGLTTRDGVPVNASLGSCVKVRCDADPSYRAPGLAEWLADGGAITEVPYRAQAPR
jgi:hypothetical protein